MTPSKTLYLVRHAKSSWKHPELGDVERPLNKRGVRDAAEMARRVARRPDRPEQIVTSPAVRAHATADAMADALGIERDAIVVLEQIYDTDAPTLIEIIRALDDAHGSVMLIGHHPGITDAVNALADSVLDKVSTCGVAVLRLDAGSWSAVAEGNAELIELDAPKKHPA